MSNNFDGPVLLEDLTEYIGWGRVGSSSTNARIYRLAGDPNGIVTAPVGTLILDEATPALWQNTNGISGYAQVAATAEDAVTLVWEVGTVWDDIYAVIATGVYATIIIERDPGGNRFMTAMGGVNQDFSKVWFIGSDQTGDNLLPIAVDFEAGPPEFQIAYGGVLRSKDITWYYGARIGSGAGVMSHLQFELNGGGIKPQPGYTGDIVRIGKGSPSSSIKLENGASIGDPTLIDTMFGISPIAPAPPYVMSVFATTGAIIGPNSFTTSVLNPFAPYGVPVDFDASVAYSPSAHTGGSFSVPRMLDEAGRVAFDSSIYGLLSATEAQSAIDELTDRTAAYIFFAGSSVIPSGTLPLLQFMGDTTAANVDYTLPLASSVPAGQRITAIKCPSTANQMRLLPQGGDTINGVAGIYMVASFGSLGSTTVVSDGVSGWWIV